MARKKTIRLIKNGQWLDYVGTNAEVRAVAVILGRSFTQETEHVIGSVLCLTRLACISILAKPKVTGATRSPLIVRSCRSKPKFS